MLIKRSVIYFTRLVSVIVSPLPGLSPADVFWVFVVFLECRHCISQHPADAAHTIAAVSEAEPAIDCP